MEVDLTCQMRANGVVVVAWICSDEQVGEVAEEQNCASRFDMSDEGKQGCHR